jgi:adenine-specific DNA-methyltransferase
MEKLKMHSPDQVETNLDRLQELFPGCITSARDAASGRVIRSIDIDRLRQEVADRVVQGPTERYALNWPGKRESILISNAPISKCLRPQHDDSLQFATTRNIFVEGDNLDVLKLLQETYLAKVKLVYLDPPYNTGHDFIYDDDFAESTGAYLERSQQHDSVGNRLVANPETNGRFHSDWLTMIAPRIRLSQSLLRDDGAIFVSCDEIEQPRLRLVMDEIFGASNFIADMVWAAGRKNDSRLISVSHEYIVCYAKNAQHLREQKIEWRQRKKGLEDIYAEYERLKRVHKNHHADMTDAMKAWFRGLSDSHPSKAHKHYSHVDARGLYFPDNISWPGGGGPKYPVLHPVTGKPVKVPSRGWMTSDQSRMRQWIEEDRVHFGPDETTVPCIKSYLRDKEQQTPYSVFYQDGRAASKRLRELMGGDCFDFPKDELVLQEIIEMLTSGDDIVLDLFAGSGTTAHAVMAQNAKDGGRRRFIAVQLAEECPKDSPAAAMGFATISALARERIRRAGKRLQEQATHERRDTLDVGFRAFSVDSSNMADVYYAADALPQARLQFDAESVKPGRGPADLLFQVLVDWGVDLALPIESRELAGRTVYCVDGNALVACFETGVDEALVRELATLRPLRAVFRDGGYASDSTKINVEQIFKLLSPETEVRSL